MTRLTAPTCARTPSVLERLWVLALFAIAPLLPGYRGLRLPLPALASALFAGLGRR